VTGSNSFIDSRKIESGSEIDTDVCIIGAGAAGITLVREIAGRDLRVALLETGGLDYEEDIQSLGKIQSLGHSYDVDGSRLRYFGGTTNHWGGHCAPLEQIDFEVRDWIPDSGWPFGLEHLKPYYDRAHGVIEIGNNSYDLEPIVSSLGFKSFPFTGQNVVSTLSRYNAQRFGSRYASEIDKTAGVKVYLYATVVSIDLDDGPRRASHVTVKTLSGNEIKVKAREFVVATGGIENARLLLDSDRQQSNGLGNRHGLVGRYFQDHIWYPNSLILPKSMNSAYDIYTRQIRYEEKDSLEVRCHVAISQEMTRTLRIPKFRAEIAKSSDVALAYSRLKELEITVEDVGSLLGNPRAVWRYLSSGKAPRPNAYFLQNYVEQVPNPESRVSLSSDRNALGQRLATLDWRLSEIDRRGIRAAHGVIAREVGRSRFGRFRDTLPDDDEEEVILDGAGSGYHHVGTTRMHDDPRRGVVDRNCRLHGFENIYVAGSSVFPCSGWANPTLTIVALAIRLADHLKKATGHG
jgi:choline dehydrogenase-like flavoprotein